MQASSKKQAPIVQKGEKNCKKTSHSLEVLFPSFKLLWRNALTSCLAPLAPCALGALLLCWRKQFSRCLVVLVSAHHCCLWSPKSIRFRCSILLARSVVNALYPATAKSHSAGFPDNQPSPTRFGPLWSSCPSHMRLLLVKETR